MYNPYRVEIWILHPEASISRSLFLAESTTYCKYSLALKVAEQLSKIELEDVKCILFYNDIAIKSHVFQNPCFSNPSIY